MKNLPDICQAEVMLERSDLINFRYIGNGVYENYYLVTQLVTERYLGCASIPDDDIEYRDRQPLFIELARHDDPNLQTIANCIDGLIESEIDFELVSAYE